MSVMTTPEGAVPRNQMGVRVFDATTVRADPSLVQRVALDTVGLDLAAPAIVLPDFHHKADQEMPSSLAVATRETIRPRLTSSSVNCGMALIALDIDKAAPEHIEGFFRRVRVRTPYPPRYRAELTRSDVIRCAIEGAEFAVDHYGATFDELERIEEGGRLDVERYGGEDALRKTLPWLSTQLSRLRFGTIGPTNHFVEMQRVEEVFDPEVAQALGVAEGQTTLHYHAGGGVLTGQIGRLFARRRKESRPMRLQMAVQRPVTHLLGARTKGELARRIELYFRSGDPVELGEPEGRRLMLANAAAMNYGFAFRAAIYSNLRRVADATFGDAGMRLVVDSPHNSIYEEEVDDRPAVVHRHNSARAFPASRMPVGSTFATTGQALLLPGTHRTSTYLCVTGPQAHRSLYSASHGAGTLVAEYERTNRSRLHPRGTTTLRFRYDDGAPTLSPHMDDRGVDAALEILVGNGLVRPIARMRPMAVLH